MAKFRIVNTRFWDDSYIAGLSPNEKLLFLYLLTNSLTTIAGVYELPIKRAVFDTSLPSKEVEMTLERFERDGKIVRQESWIGIVNFLKHQSLNPKVRKGIAAELERVPKDLLDRLSVEHNLCIDYDRLSHSNSNLNSNPNTEVSTSFPQFHSALNRLTHKLSVKRGPTLGRSP